MNNGQIPNIFIKEIDLFDSSDIEIGIKITTAIKDTKEKNNWSNKKTSKFMKVLMVVSSNSELNLSLTKGEVKFDIGFLKKNYGSDSRVKIYSKPAKSLYQIQDNENINFLDSYKIKYDNTVQEVKAFCQVYFETSEMLQSINLSSASVARKPGPITSDTIIESGRPAISSTIFLLPEGKQYSGPVHFQPGKGYMVGHRHSSEVHAVLKTLPVLNFKIKDFRKKNYAFSKPNNKANPILISKLKYSIDKRGTVTGIFSINSKNLIINKTKYGYFLKSLSRDIILQNINNIKIKNLQVIRKRIDVDETLEIIKSFSPFGGAVLDSKNNNFGSISELIINEDNIRMFQFTDKTIDKTSSGTYEYHIKLSFNDPTISFITNLIQDLRRSEKDISNYYNMVNKKKNYDFKLDSIRPRLYKSEFNKLNSINYENPSWSIANEVYVKTMSYLYELTDIEKSDLTFSNSTKLDPRNATIFSLRSFKEDFTKLLLQFDNAFDLPKKKIQFDSQKTFVKTSNSKNIIFINHKFKQAVRLKNYLISYNYLNTSNATGALILEKEQLIKRMEIENNKFFSRPPSSTEIARIPDKLQLLFNLQENYFSFLSPLSLNIKNTSINLKNIDEVKVESINNLFNRSFKNIVTATTSTDNESNVSEEMSANTGIVDNQAYSDHIEITDTKVDNEVNSTSTSKNVEDYLNSANYLGDKSLFVRSEINKTESEIQATTELPEDIAELYDIPPNINEPTPSNYTLDFIRNIVSLANQSLEERDIQNFLLSLPNQIRALFLYLFPFVKKIQGFPNIEIINNLIMQASININYYKLVRVEIFDGYELSSDGEILLNMPKFKPISKRDLDSLNKKTMCRLKRYYNNDLKLRRDILSFPIENQYFFIEPTETQSQDLVLEDNDKKIRNITVQHIVSRNYDSAGSTSNIIVQPNNIGDIISPPTSGGY